MTWLNPLVLLGAVALGVPILIHLFGRRLARRIRFPSLRLLGEAQPTPSTRRVPSDLLLLVVRCAILLSAVVALAQPLWNTPGRAREAGRPVRMILVDSSASMNRLTSDSTTALDAARLLARTLLDSARAGMVVESAPPGSSLRAASSWLASRGGRREVVVVSDFQVGAVHDGQVAVVPQGIGLRFERIAVGGAPGKDGALPALDSLRADSSGTYASWRLNRADSLPWPEVRASADEAVQVESHAVAIRSLYDRGLRATGRVAVVFPGYASRTEVANRAAPLDGRWQGDLLVALERDRVLADMSRSATSVSNCVVAGTVIARNDRGEPIASLARAAATGPGELLLFTCADAGSMVSLALLAAVAMNLDPLPFPRELDPAVLPDEQLERWRREPLATSPQGTDQTSPDGRWLWLLALVLLGVEEILRRKSPRRAARQEPEVTRARVA